MKSEVPSSVYRLTIIVKNLVPNLVGVQPHNTTILLFSSIINVKPKFGLKQEYTRILIKVLVLDSKTGTSVLFKITYICTHDAFIIKS